MSCNCPALDWWLKDLAAKVQLVKLLQQQDACLCDAFGHHFAVEDMLKTLAMSLAHRPGYREDWRP